MELINLYIESNPEDRSGVSAIALVDSPAIEEGWMAFANHKPNLKKHTIQLGTHKGNFKTVNGEQQMLAGALMIPDKKIYRKDIIEGKEKEYEVMFTPKTILQIQEKFAISNRNTAINEMHNSEMPVNAVVIQHFIIDSKNGINAPFNQDLPDGTWYGYIKVLDKNKWDTFIKTGIYTGFSVEGFFYEQSASELNSDEEALLNDLLTDNL
jgi:hypothetical protein